MLKIQENYFPQNEGVVGFTFVVSSMDDRLFYVDYNNLTVLKDEVDLFIHVKQPKVRQNNFAWRGFENQYFSIHRNFFTPMPAELTEIKSDSIPEWATRDQGEAFKISEKMYDSYKAQEKTRK